MLTAAPGPPFQDVDVRNPQANLRRAATSFVRAGAPATQQDRRARGVLVGRDLFDGVRDRRDPVRDCRRRDHQPPARPRRPRAHRDRGRAPHRDRRHLLPADDLRLSERRRGVRREPREPRRTAVAGRRGVDPRRLHPHGRGLRVGRRRRHHLDPAVPRHRDPPSRRGRARPHPADQRGEPARHQGVGSHLRDPDVRLHRRGRRPRRHRADQELLRLVRRREPGAVRPRKGRGAARDRGHDRLVPHLEGFLVGCGRAHRDRGDLRWRPRLPAPRGEERGGHARAHGHDPGHAVPRRLGAGDPVASVPERRRHRVRADGRAGVRRRSRAVGAADPDGRNSDPGRQHGLRRFPPALVDRRA